MKKYNISLFLLSFVSCLFFSCSRENSRFEKLQKQRVLVEDSIGNGHEVYAFKQIDKYMAEASDSTTYYLWLSTRNKAFYAKMLADSMLVADKRICAYLERNSKAKGKPVDMLRAEWLMARGVLQAALMGRPDSGLVYNQRATAIIRMYNDNHEQLLTALTNTADYYRQMGQLDLSADAYLQALALADSMKTNRNALGVVELGIATAYTYMGDYDNSGYWWKQIEKKVGRMLHDDQFIFYNNRGNDLYFQRRYGEAMPYFKKAVELVKDRPQKEWDYYTALANMGENYVCLGKRDEARKALDEAEAFFKKVGFGVGLYYTATSYMGLAMLEGKPSEALELIKNSATPDHMIPTAVMLRLQQEERVMTVTGNYRMAYDIHKRMDGIKDSIQATNIRMRMNANLLQFKHDKQLAEQQHVIDQQRIITITAWALCFVALLVVGILVALIFLQRKRNQLRELAEQQKVIKLRMENARNRISPHFIYNALNHELLSQLKGKEVNLYALTQLLRRGVTQANNLVTTLKEEMEFVNYYVGIEGQQMGDDFEYDVAVDSSVDIDKVSLPSMAVQIFAENAIKHGLRTMKPRSGVKRRLSIRISRCKEAFTQIEVIDNGLGLGANSTDSTHTGMRIIRQTIQILNDRNKEKISFGVENCCILEENHTGCRSWITIPDDYNYTL